MIVIRNNDIIHKLVEYCIHESHKQIGFDDNYYYWDQPTSIHSWYIEKWYILFSTILITREFVDYEDIRMKDVWKWTTLFDGRHPKHEYRKTDTETYPKRQFLLTWILPEIVSVFR